MRFCYPVVIIPLMPLQKLKGRPPYPLIPWCALARYHELAPLRGSKIRNVAPVRPPGVDLSLLFPLWVCCLCTDISFCPFFFPFVGHTKSKYRQALPFFVSHWLFEGSFLSSLSLSILSFFPIHLFVWKRFLIKRNIFPSRWRTPSSFVVPVFFWGRNLDFICIPSCAPTLSFLWYPFLGAQLGCFISRSFLSFVPLLFFPPPRVCPSWPSICWLTVSQS